MTCEEWKALYYPVPATEACGTALEAAEHSLRKWRGLAAEPVFGFDCSETCALCQFSWDGPKRNVVGGPDCGICPLVLSGHAPCEYVEAAWRKWDHGSGSADRMVAELEETVEWCKKQEGANAGK